MRTLLKVSILLLFLLSACNLPEAGTTVEPAPEQPTDATGEDYSYTECGFAWAREPLEELSKEFDAALKTLITDASGYAEAYGENCLNNQGEPVRFLAMETDFYATLIVEHFQDKQALGEMLEEVMRAVAQFPVEETPGPQPGYVGVTFKTSTEELRLWFPQREAEAALENGLRGAGLFEALQAK